MIYPSAGGPRGWAAAQANSGRGACKNSAGTACDPPMKFSTGKGAGGNPALWPRWQQAGHLLMSTTEAGVPGVCSVPLSTCTQREPVAEQISVHCTPDAAITACDTAGAMAMPITAKIAMKAQH